MDGMKSGSGDDPFADVETEDESEEDDVEAEPVEETSDRQPLQEPDTETRSPRVPDHPSDDDSQLPWIHRRDGVKQDRTPKTIHYTEHTIERERRELVDDVEEALGEEPELTDVREAAYLVGMNHVDEVAEVLREWGYAIE